MNILIIGGTRHIGHFLTLRLLEEGHRVTLLNRGISRDDLPATIPRLHCDRTDAKQLQRAIGGRSFDAVIDNVLYDGDEAETIVNLLKGSVGRYVALSTGQVYLVREGITRPFKESDFAGDVIAEPEPITYDHEEWAYGTGKRQAEQVLMQAWEQAQFPYTTLRLPMVNGERDTFHRLYGYILRIKDGGPILVPETPDYPVCHVYSHDVVEAIVRVLANDDAIGKAYNISQDEVLKLEAFLGILGDILGIEPQIERVERDLLDANGLLPDCSPFSDTWMSELDNSLSKAELGMAYTPVATYLTSIVRHYEQNPPPQPASYRRRSTERSLVLE